MVRQIQSNHLCNYQIAKDKIIHCKYLCKKKNKLNFVVGGSNHT